MEVVHEMLRAVRPSLRHVLQNREYPERCLSESVLSGALKRMGYANRLTGHGIRVTFSTALNEIGYPVAWIKA